MSNKPSPLILFLFLALILLLSPACASAEEKVLVLEISDSITPVSDDLVADALLVAQQEGYEALVITLNTPGGGVEETLRIIEAIDQSEVPVIGYVYPGGKAWSAGTLILLGTDIAAMAPYTVIGSAQPVTVSTGGIEPVEDDKIVNALVALAKEKANQHGRNETAAEKFITENLNLNAEDALEAGVIEYVATDVEDLLEQVDGETIKGKELNTSGATIDIYVPSLRLSFMDIISDPIISSLLIMLGIYGIVIGISNPGAGAEIFGVVAISLGLVGMGFDVNIAAIFLIILGVILFVLELQAPGIGIFGISGLICLIAGSIFLVPMDFPRWYTPADVQQMMIIAIVTPTIVMGLLFVFVFYKVLEVRHRKPVIGEDFAGDLAEAIDKIDAGSKGFVRYKGEYWKALSEDDLEEGDTVMITDKKGPLLLVKKE
ncbi:Nodulation efficiency protein NfeD [Methanococcoides vulcani]|uniref:Nodulation efficiency protein NfeD n=1 Tax=Methanococcoides vulcani TaxID=1353158 RepID=A0A1H9Z0E6_9EURY|nr:nodulation protein NfeD [Methanococcoides vulcani]SES74331.1 Nodulation efficiency protein NfeD [Methanococcoides vulcani]